MMITERPTAPARMEKVIVCREVLWSLLLQQEPSLKFMLSLQTRFRIIWFALDRARSEIWNPSTISSRFPSTNLICLTIIILSWLIFLLINKEIFFIIQVNCIACPSINTVPCKPLLDNNHIVSSSSDNWFYFGIKTATLCGRY